MINISKVGWCLDDKLLRPKMKFNEISKYVLKSLLSSAYYFLEQKLYFAGKFSFFSKASSISCYRGACLFQNNSRVVFRHFKLSRDKSKQFASMGFLLGLRKASF